ncbi:hypothetical protein QAD02_012679 [Eretmocerus hayati]|uniref:Uncharacterized protein n=1 Tax=Eretmocerus hayati TaxID=131215 RepID=A0ACC2P0G9_9HYME|nr:hypothetical protein QAD02_012679 [Eretmocerus hayati]
MYPWMAIELLRMIEQHLPNHYLAVPLHEQLLGVLRFLAEGSYQKGVGNDHKHPMSQITFSTYILIVIPSINTLRNRYIHFPDTEEGREVVSQRFAPRVAIDGVLAAIDCILVNIFTATDHEDAYTRDMGYRFTPERICSGRTHDHFIWVYSDVRRGMYRARRIAGGGHFYLIGDEGYTSSPVLLNAIRGLNDASPERLYSNAIRTTRCIVEQSFGILKIVWRCLHADNTLHYEPHFAAEIIVACVILHNFLRERGMPLPNLVIEANQNEEEEPEDVDDSEFQLEIAERDAIIRRYFTH